MPFANCSQRAAHRQPPVIVSSLVHPRCALNSGGQKMSSIRVAVAERPSRNQGLACAGTLNVGLLFKQDVRFMLFRSSPGEAFSDDLIDSYDANRRSRVLRIYGVRQ
jgi:hypothetical protein